MSLAPGEVEQAPATPPPATGQGRLYMGPSISDEQFNALPQGARVSVAPPADLSADQQAALQHRLALSTMPARGVVAPPDGSGIQMPDLGTMAQMAYSRLPVDQAKQAIEAAVRYQGIRGYQDELKQGKSSAEALMKWAPMLFHGTTGMATLARNATANTITPLQQAQLSQKSKAQESLDTMRKANQLHQQALEKEAQARMTSRQAQQSSIRVTAPLTTERLGQPPGPRGTRAMSPEEFANYQRSLGTNAASGAFAPAAPARLVQAPAAPAAAPSAGGVPTVTTQAQYDALPPNAFYISKNGKRHQKPPK